MLIRDPDEDLWGQWRRWTLRFYAGAFHAEAVASLCNAEGWDSWNDLAAVTRALSAPGVTTLVAIDEGQVVGAAQVLADGEINWILGMLIVAPSHRRRGIGKRLVAEVFDRTKALRLDLLTEDDGPRFYRSLTGREMSGFRLYPS